MATNKKLGELLVEAGLVTAAQVDEALAIQKRSGKRIGEILVEAKRVTEQEVTAALSRQLSVPLYDGTGHVPDPAAVRLVPASVAWRHRLVPVSADATRLVVVVSDPLNVLALDDVQLLTGLEVSARLAAPGRIADLLRAAYGDRPSFSEDDLIDRLMSVRPGAVEPAELMQSVDDPGTDQAPIVRLVNLILADAVSHGASEIHIEPQPHRLDVRWRWDGELCWRMTPPVNAYTAIRNRLGIMADLPLAKVGEPRTGRFSVGIRLPGPGAPRADGTVAGSEPAPTGGSGSPPDGRSAQGRPERHTAQIVVRSLPTASGERLVAKIVDDRALTATPQELGLELPQLALLKEALDRRSGLILVVGLADSGRTTTLHTLASGLCRENRLVALVEDRLELKLPGVAQVICDRSTGHRLRAIESCLDHNPHTVVLAEL
ncbi:MAG: Flp pilus assembly complex ATPase component TadA [Candidatus Riflebacteria bacterium]|nr:Flp pilus assembly complex ATPase component TadA [Candidatus Riflebacteria bacterium]